MPVHLHKRANVTHRRRAVVTIARLIVTRALLWLENWYEVQTMALTTQQRATIALDIAERDLQTDLQHGIEVFRVASANGEILGLLLTLADIYLTDEQHQQVKRISQLHKQCAYGRVFES